MRAPSSTASTAKMRVLGTCVPRKKAVILQRRKDAAFFVQTIT